MGIDARVEDERGEALLEVSDAKEHLYASLDRADLRQTICLRFIDPWGDTVFNQLQLAVLAEELQFLAKTTDAPTREHLLNVLRLVQYAARTEHTYVRFVGD